MKTIAVIGGGAAGLMAAGTAHAEGASVTLFEKNSKLGRKLAITGKGRCNVTNDCTETEFLANIVTNPRFMFSSVSAFSPSDVMDFFKDRKVALKTERGGRVFPVSDRAYDIVDALGAYASKCKIVHEAVTDIAIEDGQVTGVFVKNKFMPFDAVIICTGGASYPLTGSTGDGYRFAEKAGHTVISPRPALIPIETDDRYDLAGLSLRNVTLSVRLNGKTVYSELGEMLFTHFGVSGPLVLTASSLMKHSPLKDYEMTVDLKPALDEAMLDRRIVSDFEKYKNKNFGNALSDLLPIKLIPIIIRMSGISEFKKVHAVSKEERLKLISVMKSFPLSPVSFRPIEEAIITSGGVSVKEIDPKTMRSKLINGLYFAGEIIDVDAFTGGFNLQIAFSTGRAAGLHSAQEF